MTWLIGKIVGNPYVLLALVAGAFLFGVSSGGGAAWWIQGLRITSEQQNHTQYVQDQTRIFQEAQHAADLQRDKANQDYERASKLLADSIAAGDSFRRCVAAGKCGVRKPPAPATCTQSIRLPSSGLADGARGGAISSTTGTAAPIEESEEIAPVVIDCAKVQLKLNHLQWDIEAQENYFATKPVAN